MDERIAGIGGAPRATGVSPPPRPAASPFQDALAGVLKVSSHAQDRIQARGFQFRPEELQAVADAMDAAAKAGSKTAAVVTEQAVLVVSPKNRTVITAIALNLQQPMTLVNRIDTLVFLGRTSTEETQRSRPTEGAPTPVGHWSLLDSNTVGGVKRPD